MLLITLLAALESAQAAPRLLLTDNYDGTGTPNTFDLNYNLGVRQTGEVAPVTYTATGNVQVGNTGEPHDFGNVLLCAFGGNGALNHNFNGVESAGGLSITFDLDPNSHVDHADTADWGAMTLGSSQANRTTFVVSSTPHFGILFRANGRLQAFDGGAVVSPTPEPNWAPDGNYSGQLHRFQVLCTDPDDGNPFDGIGSTKIEVFVDGNPAPAFAFTKSNGGYADNYINLQGSFIVDFDNLEILQPFPPLMEPVTITSQPESQCVAEGQDVTFTVAATGIPTPTYQWKYNGVDIPGATSPTLTVSGVTIFEAGDYRVDVSNSSGTVPSSIAKLTVGLPMNNPSFEVDTFSNFPGYVSNNRAITGWNSLGNHGINPGTSFSPFADNGTIPHGRQVAFLQGDGAMSQVVSGFFPDLEYYVVYYENSRQGDSGTDPAIEVKVGGVTVVPAHTVPPVGGANPYRQVISETFVATAGDLEIAFIKSNPQGGDNTALIDNVCIVELPFNTPPTIIRDPAPTVAQVGESATLTVQAQGSLPLSYQWRKDGVDIPGATGSTLTLNNVAKSDEADYSVHVSNTSGNATSGSGRLTVFEPIPDLYNTGLDDNRAPVADGLADPHYTLITNPDTGSTNAIVEDSTAFPIVAGPWLPNTASAKWIGPKLNTSDSAVGLYTYRTTIDLTDRDPSTVVIIGRWATDNVGRNILVNGTSTGNRESPGFDAYTSFAIASSNATFVAGINTIDFVVDNVQTAGYTGLRVEIVRSNVRIPPGTHPAIASQPQSQKAVVGDTVTFTVTATGSAPLSYHWKKNGTEISGATSSTLTLSNVSTADAGNYTVVVQNPVGFVESEPASLCVLWRRLPTGILFGTGVDNNNAPLADGAVDPHYQLILSDDPNYPGPNAVVINEAWPIAPLGPWLPNGPASRWIAPRAEQDQVSNPSFGNAAGRYHYLTTFDLTGYAPGEVSIAGRWAVDNTGVNIFVNGVGTGITSPGFGGYTPFTIPTSALQTGINTLAFHMSNDGAFGPTGLRVELDGLINLQRLSVSRGAGGITISWTPTNPCQKLQCAASVEGPWVDCPDQSNPQTIVPCVSAPCMQFYRVSAQ